jgi:integrase
LSVEVRKLSAQSGHLCSNNRSNPGTTKYQEMRVTKLRNGNWRRRRKGAKMGKNLIKSDRTIETLKLGAGRLTDGDGLFLIPYFEGREKHVWRFSYSFELKRKTISFGAYPSTSLALAREKAREARELLARGINPSAVRQDEKEARRERHEAEERLKNGEPAIGTFEEIARRWFEKTKDEWMPSYSDKVIRRLELHAFPHFGHLMMQDVRPKHIVDSCRLVEQNGTIETAHRVLKLCSLVFGFAIGEGWDIVNPCVGMNKALKKAFGSNFAAITKPGELAILLQDIEDYSGTMVVRSALKLAPMLMVRPGELRKARWDEFDLDTAQWYVPSMNLKRAKEHKLKGEPHWVPLPTQAVRILEELFLLTGHTGFVFPCEGKPGKCMSDGAVNKALRTMGYSSDVVTGHGFRATARTMQEELLDVPVAVSEMQLAHAVPDTNGTAYNRTQWLLARQEMMQKWANYLEDLRLGRSNIKQPVLPTFRPVTQRMSPAAANQPDHRTPAYR